MSEPRTKAGRDLLGLVDLRAAAVSVSVEFLQHQILAIEREAADVDAWAACSKCAWRVGGAASMMEAATWLREHQEASHAAPAPGGDNVSAPRTEAGKRLLDAARTTDNPYLGHHLPDTFLRDAIRAIEAEAAPAPLDWRSEPNAEERFGHLPMDEYKAKMTPEAFKWFVQSVGMWPAPPPLDGLRDVRAAVIVALTPSAPSDLSDEDFTKRDTMDWALARVLRIIDATLRDEGETTRDDGLIRGRNER